MVAMGHVSKDAWLFYFSSNLPKNLQIFLVMMLNPDVFV